ncbi:MAG: response regulator [Mesorhizobium sp.]|nr:MAG: response regulator [Mesorhizobium sp.]
MATRPARKILIVEDEFLIALHLADLLVEMGHRIAGTVDNLDEAIVFARDEQIDFAILDINLAGTRSFPVADVLNQRGIPFLFVSGYGSDGLVDGCRHITTLAKPYAPQELERAIAASFCHV